MWYADIVVIMVNVKQKATEDWYMGRHKKKNNGSS